MNIDSMQIKKGSVAELDKKCKQKTYSIWNLMIDNLFGLEAKNVKI